MAPTSREGGGPKGVPENRQGVAVRAVQEEVPRPFAAVKVRLRLPRGVRGQATAIADLEAIAQQIGQEASARRVVLRGPLQEDPNTPQETVALARVHPQDAGWITGHGPD